MRPPLASRRPPVRLLAVVTVILIATARRGSAASLGPATAFPRLAGRSSAELLLDARDRSLPSAERMAARWLAARVAKTEALASRHSDRRTFEGLLANCGNWTTLYPNTPAFESVNSGAIYDPVRDRVLAYGGYGSFDQPGVWALSLTGTPAWTLLVPPGTGPGFRVGSAVVYDSVHDRLIVFGGSDFSNYFDDAWVLTLSGTPAWTQLTPSGTAPAGRAWASGIYDASRDRLVVFGGNGFGSYNDAWSLTLGASPSWSQITPTGGPPDARFAQTAIYDAPRDRMIVYGGSTDLSYVVGDLWSLSFAGTPAWTQLAPTGTVPTPRNFHTAIFDAPRNRMIVQGGYTDNGVDFSGQVNDTWSLALTGTVKWTKLSPAGTLPPEDDSHSAIYDSPRQRMLVFGGVNVPDELWSLALSTNAGWSQLALAGPPRQRDSQAGILDVPRNRLVLFGGWPASGTKNDVWTFDLTSHVWTQIIPSGTPPSRRYDATAIFDAPRNRMVVFGGNESDPQGNDVKHNDVWTLTLTGTPTWTQLNPGGTDPVARSAHSAIFDPTRNRMVIYGGDDGVNGALDDVRALSLSGGSGSWALLSPTGTPPGARYEHTAIYDAPRDRMVVYGGFADNTPETWSLTFTGTPAWTLLTSIESTPEVLEVSAVYDATRDRMVVTNGDQTHALTLSGTPTWSAVGFDGFVPEFRYDDLAFFDAANDRLLMQGGIGNGELNDVQAMAVGASKVTLTVTPNDELGGIVSREPDLNCYDPGTVVTLTAMPAFGYAFVSWSGDASGTSNPLSVTMTSDMTIVANFVTYLLDLSVLPAAAGSIQSNPNQPRYTPGTVVTLTATPSSTGYAFIGWEGDASGSTNPLTITMDSNKSIVATFEANCGYWGSRASDGPATYLHSAVHDPVRQRMIVFGGVNSDNLARALPYARPGVWTTLAASGTPPAARYGHAAVYDPVRDRMVLIGGNSGGMRMNDVWALTLAGAPAWSALSPAGTPPTPRQYLAAVYDPVRDRILVIGGDTSAGITNEVWELSLSGTPTWAIVVPTGGPPPARAHAAAIYDPPRDRVVLFGGTVTEGSAYLNDTWALSLSGTPSWAVLSPVGNPPLPNAAPYGVYDPVADRMLVMKDYFIEGLHGLNLDPLTWGPLQAVGGPESRRNYSFVFDPDGKQLVIHGGLSSVASPNTYTIKEDDYSLSVAATPPAGGTVSRGSNAPCYDPGAMVTLTAVASIGYMFTGWTGDASGSTNPLVVTMDASKTIIANFLGYPVTTSVSPPGTGTVTKSPNQSSYVPGSQVTLTANPGVGFAFLNWSGDATGSVNPLTITVDGPKNITANFSQPPPSCAGWRSVLSTTSPGNHTGVVAIYDPPRHRMLTFGGYNGAFLNDVWALGLGSDTWTQITPTGTPPSPRDAVGLVYDPVRDRMLVIGGNNQTGWNNQVWALSLSGAPAWTQILPAGTPPVPRFQPCVIYDPLRDRVLLFGGYVASADNRNDVWELSLQGTPSWIQLSPGGSLPTGRYGAASIYDPVRDRMLVYGGSSPSTLARTDLWELSLNDPLQWTQLDPAGTPYRWTRASTGVYDAERDRMIIFGGYDNSLVATNETYVLSLKYQLGWVQLTPTAPIPGARGFNAAIFDPENDRMIVFGGDRNSSPIYGDAHALSLEGGNALDLSIRNPQFGSVTKQLNRSCYPNGESVTLTANPIPNHLFVGWHGDAAGTTNPLTIVMNGHKAIVADFVPIPTAVGDGTPAVFELGAVFPNPTGGEANIAFSLGYASRVRVAVIDVAGREVARLVDGVETAGKHSVVWNGRDGRRAAASGIYFVRYDSPAGSWTRRVALMH